MREPVLDLHPLKPEDIPDVESPEFAQFLDSHFDLGQKLIDSMTKWPHHSSKVEGTVDIRNLTSSCKDLRKTLNVKEYWCGRISHHTPESVVSLLRRTSSRSLHHMFNRKSTEVDHHAAVMKSEPLGIYERFRRGLLEYHSQNERDYIEACREAECLQVFQPHVAEVWRLTYKTPPPTYPRTFVVLLLSREVEQEVGSRSFMNISIPFSHPDCPEKQGGEKSRVRGKYVSVEKVRELDGGAKVEWAMATSSDAGGNVPRFMTNSSLPSSIAEDVPSFLKWLGQRFPGEGGTATIPLK